MTKPATPKRNPEKEEPLKKAAPKISKQYDDSKQLISIKGVLISLVFSFVFACAGTYLFAKPLIEPVGYSLPPAPPFEGALKQNEVLAKAERLLLDQIYGPESLAIHPVSGRLWASMKTGLICEIALDGDTPEIKRAVSLTNFTDCDGSYTTASRCGRPLGLRITPKGELLVADAYLGLFLIDLDREKVSNLFASGSEVNNDLKNPTRYLNDLDVLPDGRIVMSESSHRFDDRDFLLDLFEHRPNGRILTFKPSTGELKALAKNLYFPNGIQVYGNDVIYSEMGMARIQRINYKTLETETIVDNLPGYPDNLRMDKLGQLLVPIPTIRDSFDAWLAERPGLRAFITTVLSPRALAFVAEYFTTPYGLVLRVDPLTGRIIESYHDTKGETMPSISMALETTDGRLYLGSDTNYFLGRLENKYLFKKNLF
ncbi:unnamed protein product, partial [Mesorhabditis spiculigera]